VRGIPLTKSLDRPLPKTSLSLNGILVRMLPQGDERQRPYQQALDILDAKFGLLDHIKDQFNSHKFVPRVHAEIQVLEHFYEQNLEFVYNDRFIACSKPACYCCHLYFVNHPGRPVVPATHRKIWLNWGPPQTMCESGPTGKRQRDIMNRMLGIIRGDALQYIADRERTRQWHADSHTGITESVENEGHQAYDDISRDGFSSSEEG
jgi:hypothetical protein